MLPRLCVPNETHGPTTSKVPSHLLALESQELQAVQLPFAMLVLLRVAM